MMSIMGYFLGRVRCGWGDRRAHDPRKRRFFRPLPCRGSMCQCDSSPRLVGFRLRVAHYGGQAADITGHNLAALRVSAEAACLASGVPFVVELAGKKLDAKTTKTASYDEYSMVDIGVAEIAAVGPCEVKVRPKDAKSWKPINLRKLILAPEK